MGEGSSNQGDVHEALNFAAIHKLPFVFVVENNGYAISVPAAMELAVPDVAVRAAGYGIPGVVVDGTDVLACYVAAKTAIDRARAGDGPTLIEAKVTRLTGHSSDDQQTKYRTAAEMAGEKEPRCAAALPRPAARRRDPDDGGRGRARPPRSEAIVDRCDRLRRGRARSRAVDGDALGLRRGLAVGDAAAVGLRRRLECDADAGSEGGRSPTRGRRLMPTRTFIEAIRDDPGRRDAPRRVGHRPGRGRRQEGWRLPGHRRPVGRVRRGPGASTRR